MPDFLIFLTYVAEGLGLAGIAFGLLLLVRSGPEEEATYWMGDEELSRREYEVLVRDRMAAARRRGNPPA